MEDNISKQINGIFKEAFTQTIENGGFLPYDSFLVNLANLERIIFDTENLQERAKLYTYVMNNARAVDYAEITEKAFKSDAARMGIPELWELPESFEKYSLIQPFPMQSLPPLLRDYLKAVADYVQVTARNGGSALAVGTCIVRTGQSCNKAHREQPH